jgi:Rrf2 family protein
MSTTNVQFSVAVHIMTALGYYHGQEVRSAMLANSLTADPSFVRRSLSKLVKARLVRATRGKHGACALTRPPEEISLLEIYRASAAPTVFTIHDYPVANDCPVSPHVKGCLTTVLDDAQGSFERALGRMSLADVVEELRRREANESQ